MSGQIARGRLLVPVLFISGFCSLVYQISWMKELRLVFGASTPAVSVVIAIFMGGLGFGGIFWGCYVDKKDRPLHLYAIFEILISLCALASPFLIVFIRQIYFSLGGSLSLGPFFAVAVRLVLAFLVLAPATFLMGGTLPAAVKAVEDENDIGRVKVGIFYGVNTLGAVLGSICATFFMLEYLGTHKTIWIAGCINAALGALTFWLAQSLEKKQEICGRLTEEHDGDSFVLEQHGMPSRIFLGGSFILGFTFFVMELVWYRILTPILGGTTYTFGLILSAALTGIAVGGYLYGLRSEKRQVTVWLFAFTCALEAFFLMIPYALGDRIAVVAALLRPLGALGLVGHLMAWTFLAGIVVFPASVVSGFQFPVVINLLGKGRRNVGSHVGIIYGWNTAGAIVGSLVGCFFLIPFLSSVGCWKWMVGLLIFLSLILLCYSLKNEQKSFAILLPVFLLIISGPLFFAQGPTSVWRHSSIGAGSTSVSELKGMNEIRDWMHLMRKIFIWEKDGIESNVAMQRSDSLSFFINGKNDGNAVGDAGTMIMGPIIGAALHPDPKRSMVIGLGTGASAGWLAAIDSMEKVDVVELEPAVHYFTQQCGAVNRDIMKNPKANIITGDGREVLMVSKEKYDIIFSEPSNPYRAGIASLYTLEFYESLVRRLAADGIFAQWVQMYDVDRATIRTIMATLASVFPDVTVWRTNPQDMLFVCSLTQRHISIPDLRQRLKREPFYSAMLHSWQVTGVEGFMSGFIANRSVANGLVEDERSAGRINTDDKMLIEYGFARTVGKTDLFSLKQFEQDALALHADQPPLTGGVLNGDLVNEMKLVSYPLHNMAISWDRTFTDKQAQLAMMYNNFREGKLREVLALWEKRPWEPENPFDIAVISEALADTGDNRVWKYYEALKQYWPSVAEAVIGRLFFRQDLSGKAMDSFEKSFALYRKSPWGLKSIMERALSLLPQIAQSQPANSRRILDMIDEPFSAYVLDDHRVLMSLGVASMIDPSEVENILLIMEPNIPWREGVLRGRVQCYKDTGNPLVAKAEKDLQLFLKYSR